jgi:hypothetical protein
MAGEDVAAPIMEAMFEKQSSAQSRLEIICLGVPFPPPK